MQHRSPRRRRWATAGVFAVNGAAIGAWVSQIPSIQERFGLSDGALGLILMAMALAVVVALPVAGQAVSRHGSERLIWIGGMTCVLAINLPALAPAPVLVALGLFVLGGASATMDVAMNSHGVAVEQELRRPIMSSLHAGWAFGGMAGSGFAAACAALGIGSAATLALSSALLVVALALCARQVGHGARPAAERTPLLTVPSRAVALLALLCFLVMVTEGAMADWSGLYLRRDLGADVAVAALAYSAFTAGMTLGRVVGDAINHRIGPTALLRAGAVLTAVPLGVLLAIGEPVVALGGLFLVGLGVANGVPLMFSAAGHQREAPSGPSIAAVSSMGSLGFLVGPPVVGFAAELVSLPWALGMLVPAALVILALAGRATQGTGAAPAVGASAA